MLFVIPYVMHRWHNLFIDKCYHTQNTNRKIFTYKKTILIKRSRKKCTSDCDISNHKIIETALKIQLLKKKIMTFLLWYYAQFFVVYRELLYTCGEIILDYFHYKLNKKKKRERETCVPCGLIATCTQTMHNI